MAIKAFENFSKSLIEEVHKWGCKRRTGISLKYMMEFGSEITDKNLLLSAQFLHKELAIRIARRAVELENLPYGLSQKPAVLKVQDWYLKSFRDVVSFPEIKNMNEERKFTHMIKAVKLRHNNVVPTLALGIQQLKKDMDPNIDYADLDRIHPFLDRFYMSRIGIRMLIGQHVGLHNPNPAPHCIGYIHAKMSPVDVARNASEDARAMISDEGGGIPRSGLPKLFTYLYSTEKNPLDGDEVLGTGDALTLAGYGDGLPISRLYAKYFGGDLHILSMEDYSE